jgi:hypothetical protein
VFAATLVVAGLLLDLIWWYVTRDRRLVDEKMQRSFVRSVHRRILIAPFFYLIAIFASFFSVVLAYFVFLAVIIYYVVPLSFDKNHHIHFDGQEEDSV